MPSTEIRFDKGYNTQVGCYVYRLAFIVDGDVMRMAILEDTPLQDLSSGLRRLADWVDNKRPQPAAPEPPPVLELELVDP